MTVPSLVSQDRGLPSSCTGVEREEGGDCMDGEGGGCMESGADSRNTVAVKHMRNKPVSVLSPDTHPPLP